MEIIPILLRIKHVQQLVSLSRSQIYDLIKNEEFPKQVKIGGSSLWKMEDIIAYINNLENK